jgi:hypothetical protein
MTVRLVEATDPGLGVADLQQRERAQLFPACREKSLGRRKQPLRLLGACPLRARSSDMKPRPFWSAPERTWCW